jgi:hypothetical protein
VNIDRICEREGCENSIAGRKATTRFCDDRCRVASHRAGKAREAEADNTTGKHNGCGCVTPRGGPVTLGRLSTDAPPNPVLLHDPGCVNPERHRPRWLRHPATGRTVCDICHPSRAARQAVG